MILKPWAEQKDLRKRKITLTNETLRVNQWISLLEAHTLLQSDISFLEC